MLEKDLEREQRLKHYCKIFAACLLALVVAVTWTVVMVYFVLRPTKPSFYLQDLQLQCINLAVPSISLTAQVTLASRNPNHRIGVYYRRLNAFVTYRDEPVTVPVSLPPMYYGHQDVTTWSPTLSGESVPVADYVADDMKRDLAAGYVMLQVKVDGRIKWKVGGWVSGSYHLFVSCPAAMFTSVVPSADTPLGTACAVTALKFTQPTECTVSVGQLIQ